MVAVNYCFRLPKYVSIRLMAGKEPEFGPTARAVAANVKRIRRYRELNFKELSGELKAVANWELSAVAVRRIEEGLRRVSVDDLAALAVALKVTPATLMMPDETINPEDEIEAPTGKQGTLPARMLWQWLTAQAPLPGASDPNFARSAMPSWAAFEVENSVGPEARISMDQAREMAYEAARAEYRRLFVEEGWRPPTKSEGAADGDH